MQVIDCRETALKSPNMERLGFQRAMENVRQKRNVVEVVTDQHPSIKALISKYFNIFRWLYMYVYGEN